jgi:hypothetical protein
LPFCLLLVPFRYFLLALLQTAIKLQYNDSRGGHDNFFEWHFINYFQWTFI